MDRWRYIKTTNKPIDLIKKQKVIRQEALINNALIELRRMQRSFIDREDRNQRLLIAHNKKIRTKALPDVMNIINLWLFDV